MYSLGMFLPAFYQIAGYHLRIQKEPGAVSVFCPHVIDEFSANHGEQTDDFILTIKASAPNTKISENQQIILNSDSIVMEYGTETERLYVKSDLDLKHWDLYTTYRDRHIDDWYEKIGNLFAWAMPGKGALMLHGVLMEWQGKGIILTASSGTGKTTHARLWREYENALIINGDRVLIRKEEGQWYAFGTPWSGSSGECVNRKVSLDAVVFLNRGKINEVYPVSPIQGMEKILPRIIAPKWHEKYSLMAIDLAIKCLEKIPLYELYCRPDAESVCTLKQALQSAG